MNTDPGLTIARFEGPILKAYLALGTLVCSVTTLLILTGKAPVMVEDSLLAALFYLAGASCFVLAWRRLGDGFRPLRAPQAFFATAIPYLAAGVAVGSPSGDTRVPLVLVMMLLAGSLLRASRLQLKTN